jgi:hypothetical protein
MFLRENPTEVDASQPVTRKRGRKKKLPSTEAPTSPTSNPSSIIHTRSQRLMLLKKRPLRTMGTIVIPEFLELPSRKPYRRRSAGGSDQAAHAHSPLSKLRPITVNNSIKTPLKGSSVLSSSSSSSSSPVSKSHFHSCLENVHPNNVPIELRNDLSPRSIPANVLRRALSIQELGETSWLTSSFMDLVITHFARVFPNARYFSVDFSRLHANGLKDHEIELTDILGRSWKDGLDISTAETSFIFFVNAQNIHWTLVRAVLSPHPELQFFEPMGLPSRGRGLSHRSVPRSITNWLDHCLPLGENQTWLQVGISVVTEAHQITSFDCGVACLLYAEKCGLGQVSFYFGYNVFNRFDF